MNNAEWMIQNGYKFSDLHCSYMQPGSICSFYLNGKNIGKVSGLSIFEAIKTWLDMEHVEPILDEAEKRYLSAVIKPFRDRVKHIRRVWYISITSSSEYQRIYITLSDDSYNIDLPLFKKETMYKGMKIGKAYTLEELGL